MAVIKFDLTSKKPVKGQRPRKRLDVDLSGDPEAEKELQRLRVRNWAAEKLREEKLAAEFEMPPGLPSLAEELAIKDPPVSFSIEGFHPEGGNSLLSAAYKVGKTTLLGNLLRSLCDGEPFLDAFPVRPLSGRVAFLNYELTDRMFRGWLRDLKIQNLDRGVIWHLRGRRLPLTVPHVERLIIEWLKRHEVEVLILDPFARALAGAANENRNEEVGPWLEALDVIKEKAGVTDLILSSHFGRQAAEERTRGATRLDDWADSRWILTRDREDRFLSAEGRDVKVPEFKLTFNTSSRRLTMTGGNRSDQKLERLVERVLNVVAQKEGLNKTELRNAVEANTADMNRAVSEAVNRGRLRIETEGKAHRHYYVPPPTYSIAEQEKKDG